MSKITLSDENDSKRNGHAPWYRKSTRSNEYESELSTDTSTATLSAEKKTGLTHIAMLPLMNLQAAGIDPNLQENDLASKPEPYTVTSLPPERGPLSGSSKYTFAQNESEM